MLRWKTSVDNVLTENAECMLYKCTADAPCQTIKLSS